MKGKAILLSTTLFLLLGCQPHRDEVDALLRSRADALNKEAFTARYNDATMSATLARQSLAFIDDSLPRYDDGKLRAWNILATSFFNRSIHDSVSVYIDSVLNYQGPAANREMEQVLAKLLKARLLQRQCDIAGCYQILYDIEHSGLLNNKSDNLLVNLAKSEFFIGTNTLNYHYRNKSQYEQAELMVAMEEQRDLLHCDYAEDLSFNYAIAYGYYALCNDTIRQSDYLAKALHYCDENLHLLGNPTRYSTYHLANTYQLLGFILWNRNIMDDSWRKNAPQLIGICDYITKAFGFEILEKRDPDAGLSTLNYQLSYAFHREAAALFFLHDNPYQRLGAVVAAGRCSLLTEDTATARNYFIEGLGTLPAPHLAPKLEALLYESLLLSGCAGSQDDVRNWTSELVQLNNQIKQNERADFILQQELSRTHRSSVVRLVLAIIMAVMAMSLLVTLLLLRRRTLALQRETKQLQEANQRDVERIANVETCLSVLRHDITPFVSYLQNDKLPNELRSEVTGQLIRTFENIKNWTKLSIPSGLQFRKSKVALQEVFDEVSHSIMEFHAPSVKLTFLSTDVCAVGDRQLVDIMLRNLVNNAMQHTRQGSVTVSAGVLPDDQRFVHVAVTDTGSGMTREQIETLFRSDKKIKSTPEVGYGSGFGLMLCRYIIKLHDDNTLRGCRIWAESEPGEGSTFHFLLQLSTTNSQS